MPGVRRFIRHPAGIPLEFSTAAGHAAAQTRDVSAGGLAFETKSCPAEGEVLEILISTVTPAFRSLARVVWCRSSDGGYEVGVVFLGRDDAFRARMVEQVCHIENYRERVRDTEGRYLTGDAAAREWIDRYGASFPDVIEDDEAG